MDRLTIAGIEVFAHHGVLAAEKRDGQVFVIDVDLELDLADAGRTDDLVDTVDYAVLAQRIHDIASGGPFALIERLGSALLDVCMEEQLVHAATVTIHKPSAPISVAFADVAVTMRRERP